MKPNEYVTQNLPSMVKDLGELVAVPSVLDESGTRPGAPFGENNRKVLDTFLALAREMGMDTVDYDGYAGEVTVGHGEHMVGILGHLDVVEAGAGWNTEPFQMTQQGNTVFGRGVSDDKGPVISSLYAMKYIRDNGLLPQDHSIRLIVGTDEEEGLRCIEHYVKHAPRLPDCSFVPDGYFPMVNCEKGLIDFDLSFPVEPMDGAVANVLSLTGGSGRNVVAGSASCRLQFPQEHRDMVLKQLRAQSGLTVTKTEDGCLVESVGVSAHAMEPEKGKNAISILLHGLYQSGVTCSMQPFFSAYERAIGLEYTGEKLGCAFRDELSGAMTINVGTLERNGERIVLKANARYPATFTHQQILDSMAAALEQTGFTYTEALAMDPLYVPKDAPLIQKLMQAYQEVTGDMDHDAFSIGGATYARSIPNAVSFGPLFPYETELAHQANECLSLDSLEKMTQIYILALDKLLH